MANLSGQMLNSRYKVDAFIGRGGMAEVYQAQDLRRDIPVALKFLREDLSEDRASRRRFEREAQILSSLQHPNIVRLYGFETNGNLSFLVMEYIDGQVLRRVLLERSQPLTLGETLGVMEPVCRALSYAHKEGVFHCDVKPANIFIASEGRVVLSDFGISRVAESSTATYSTPGTPAYMAPEQIRGEKLGSRTDIYALGITLYEMLTLERPFEGEEAKSDTSTSRNERIRWEQLNKQPPSPRQLNPNIRDATERVILKALAKRPEDRFRSVAEFQASLDQDGSVKPVYVNQWLEAVRLHPSEDQKVIRARKLESLYTSLQETLRLAPDTQVLKRAVQLCGEIPSLDATYRDVADLLVNAQKAFTLKAAEANKFYLRGYETLVTGLSDLNQARLLDPEHDDPYDLFPILSSHIQLISGGKSEKKRFTLEDKGKPKKKLASGLRLAILGTAALAYFLLFSVLFRNQTQNIQINIPTFQSATTLNASMIQYGQTIDVNPAQGTELWAFRGGQGDRVSINPDRFPVQMRLLNDKEAVLRSDFSSLGFYSLPYTGVYYLQVIGSSGPPGIVKILVTKQ